MEPSKNVVGVVVGDVAPPSNPHSRLRTSLLAILAFAGGLGVGVGRIEQSKPLNEKVSAPGYGRRSWLKRTPRLRTESHYIDRHGQHWSNGRKISKAERKGINTVPRGYGDKVSAIAFN